MHYLEHAAISSLGFLSSPKRFNVAITRAASGLIVVGNADTLAVDPLWRIFLLCLHNNDTIIGESWDAEAARKVDFDTPQAAIKELEAKFDGLGVEDTSSLDKTEGSEEEEGW